MIEFLQLPEATRRTLIEQVSNQTGIRAKAIEKDWWVTLVLKALFSLPMAPHFIFKGGTSLSKGWKLIDRFSEDIDIALSPEAFGRAYQETPSITYVKQLKKKGCVYTSTVIRDALENKLAEMGVPLGMIEVVAEAVNPLIPDKDPQTLYIRYPSLFDASAYIASEVKAEFGVRALREPFTTITIQSIISEVAGTKAYAEKQFPIPAVEPRKTFMEKLLLLHEKFITGRAEGDAGERQSRHLSDLLQLTRRNIADQVIGDPDLYALVVHHRRHYIRLRDVDYDVMELRQLTFLPPWELLEAFRKDYAVMLEEMIYGDPPGFDTLLDELRMLNIRFASLGHQRDVQTVIKQAALNIPDRITVPSVVNIFMPYVTDPYQAEGPANSLINFYLEFFVTANGAHFHRIKVV